MGNLRSPRGVGGLGGRKSIFASHVPELYAPIYPASCQARSSSDKLPTFLRCCRIRQNNTENKTIIVTVSNNKKTSDQIDHDTWYHNERVSFQGDNFPRSNTIQALWNRLKLAYLNRGYTKWATLWSQRLYEYPGGPKENSSHPNAKTQTPSRLSLDTLLSHPLSPFRSASRQEEYMTDNYQNPPCRSDIPDLNEEPLSTTARSWCNNIFWDWVYVENETDSLRKIYHWEGLITW